MSHILWAIQERPPTTLAWNDRFSAYDTVVIYTIRLSSIQAHSRRHRCSLLSWSSRSIYAKPAVWVAWISKRRGRPIFSSNLVCMRAIVAIYSYTIKNIVSIYKDMKNTLFVYNYYLLPTLYSSLLSDEKDKKKTLLLFFLRGSVFCNQCLSEKDLVSLSG